MLVKWSAKRALETEVVFEDLRYTVFNRATRQQRRKCESGAVELVKGLTGIFPSGSCVAVMVCDLPCFPITSPGLDFAIAMEVVKLISQIASSDSCTVVSTIHQPSKEMLEQFSKDRLPQTVSEPGFIAPRVCIRIAFALVLASLQQSQVSYVEKPYCTASCICPSTWLSPISQTGRPSPQWRRPFLLPCPCMCSSLALALCEWASQARSLLSFSSPQSLALRKHQLQAR